MNDLACRLLVLAVTVASLFFLEMNLPATAQEKQTSAKTTSSAQRTNNSESRSADANLSVDERVNRLEADLRSIGNVQKIIGFAIAMTGAIMGLIKGRRRLGVVAFIVGLSLLPDAFNLQSAAHCAVNQGVGTIFILLKIFGLAILPVGTILLFKGKRKWGAFGFCAGWFLVSILPGLMLWLTASCRDPDLFS